MKTIITSLLLFAAFCTYSQSFELSLGEPNKDVTIPIENYDASKDTVIVFNTLNQASPNFILEELKDRLVINLKQVGAKAAGEYTIAVIENP